MSKKWPTVCLDFDGVIHSYMKPWQGAHIIPDAPVEGSLEAIEAYLDADMEVAIFSSRTNKPGGLDAMKRWLTRYATIHFDYDPVATRRFLAQITWPTEKPPAQLYIDDRGFHFQGQFPPADQIKRFRPWNK